MEENHLPENLLDENEFLGSIKRRRDLLPLWIKIFTWIFLVFGAIVPVVFIIGLFGYEMELSIYGLETNQALSFTGIIIMALFMIKGVTAFGLWFEKAWAVNLAIADGIIGVIVCVITMIFLPLVSPDWVSGRARCTTGPTGL